MVIPHHNIVIYVMLLLLLLQLHRLHGVMLLGRVVSSNTVTSSTNHIPDDWQPFFNFLVDKTSKSLLKAGMMLVLDQPKEISCTSLLPGCQALEFLHCKNNMTQQEKNDDDDLREKEIFVFLFTQSLLCGGAWLRIGKRNKF